MRMGNLRAWGAVLVLGVFSAACGGGDDDDDEEETRDEGGNVTPAQACARLHEVCPGFPVTEEDCIESARGAAPQGELNCVGNSEDCHEAVVDCLGYTEAQYESLQSMLDMDGGN